jgi:pyruvate/2-oxoglutarate dehydrogenase complex dihydrolipoamide dehydrogenase (E3) component
VQADLVAIGFGKGAKTLAAALGGQGKRVVMIERSAAMYGGTCINIGCVPTKSMVFQAEEATGNPPPPDVYTQAIRRTAELTADLRAKNFALLDSLPTVEVLTGTATFVDAHTVAVQTADGTVTVTGATIVISTGSEPARPDIPGLSDNPHVVTSTDLLSTEDLPRHLVVLGGGYVGLEFAAMYARYGAEVTVLERHPNVLGREDDDVATAAGELLTAAGVKILTSAAVTAVDGGTVHYEIDGTAATVQGDKILLALGRRPVTAGLGLENAGIRTRADGSVDVDEHLRTNQPHIFAVGDVNGGPQFTYVSLDDYRIVADQLTGAGARSTADRVAVPYVLFMTPPLARVGITEREARAAGRSVKVAALPVAKMATVPRARIVHQPEGLMKVVVDAETDQILGAALLSHDSHEVINVVALAMRHGIAASQLRDEIYTHPSMTEAFNQLLGALR